MVSVRLRRSRPSSSPDARLAPDVTFRVQSRSNRQWEHPADRSNRPGLGPTAKRGLGVRRTPGLRSGLPAGEPLGVPTGPPARTQPRGIDGHSAGGGPAWMALSVDEDRRLSALVPRHRVSLELPADAFMAAAARALGPARRGHLHVL